MTGGNTRKVVVIKNIRSNFIEEAILILKDNVGESGNKAAEKNNTANKAENDVSKSGNRSDAKRKDFMLAEAEDIINEYIKNSNFNDKYCLKQKNRNFALNKNRINLYINSALVFSLIMLAIIIYKLL